MSQVTRPLKRRNKKGASSIDILLVQSATRKGSATQGRLVVTGHVERLALHGARIQFGELALSDRNAPEIDDTFDPSPSGNAQPTWRCTSSANRSQSVIRYCAAPPANCPLRREPRIGR